MNQEGFFEPHIDESLCVSCGRCIDNCPAKKNKTKFVEGQSYFGLQLKKEISNNHSATSGFFAELAKYILSVDGVVYGCKYINFIPTITRITKVEDLHYITGSKYIQSIVGESYRLVKKDLSENKLVLFSGLPCQVFALKSMIEDGRLLITVDLICHGVPSIGFFLNHVDQINKKYKKKLIDFSFRAKKAIVWGYETGYLFQGEKKYFTKPYFDDLFFYAFAQGNNLNYRCYNCEFKNLNRPADISLGDLWNYHNERHVFDSKPISLVIVNNEKGHKLFSKIKNLFISEILQKNDVIKSNIELGMINNNIPDLRFSFYKSKYENLRKKSIHKEFLLSRRIKYFIKLLIGCINK